MRRGIVMLQLLFLIVGTGVSAQEKKTPAKPAKRAPAVRARLAKKVTLDLGETTLKKAVETFIEQSKDPDVKNDKGLAIFVDPIGLRNAEKTMESHVVVKADGLSLGRTLFFALKQLDMVYIVRGNLVVITDRETARRARSRR